MERLTISVDLDGTLCETNYDRIDWTNPASIDANCTPFLAAVQRVQDLIDQGHDVHVTTARRRIVQGLVTRTQLTRWGLGAISDDEHLHMMRRPWAPLDILVHKHDTLREIDADLHVGDEEVDQSAATSAGVRFMDARDFRAGAPLHLDGEPMVHAVIYVDGKEGEGKTGRLLADVAGLDAEPMAYSVEELLGGRDA